MYIPHNTLISPSKAIYVLSFYTYSAVFPTLVVDHTQCPTHTGSTTGPNYYVRVLSTIDRELLKPNSSVALHKHSNALVDVLPPEADSSIAMLTADEKPDVSYVDIGELILQVSFIRPTCHSIFVNIA